MQKYQATPLAGFGLFQIVIYTEDLPMPDSDSSFLIPRMVAKKPSNFRLKMMFEREIG